VRSEMRAEVWSSIQEHCLSKWLRLVRVDLVCVVSASSIRYACLSVQIL
jgi:hypothetical protein